MTLPKVIMPDKHFELIGRITTQWCMVDFMVSELVRGLEGMSEEDANRTVRAKQFGEKLKWAYKKIASQTSGIELDISLNNELSRAGKLADARNLVAHMIVFNDKLGDFNNPRGIKFKGVYSQMPQELTESYLQRLYDDIIDCTRLLCEKNIFYGYITIHKISDTA